MEVFFKNVLTKMEGHVLGEEHSNFLTYDHQYTRFDQAGAWSAEGSVARPAVLSFYIRSSLVREKNNVAPANKLSSVLSYFGGTQSAWKLIFIVPHLALITVVRFFVGRASHDLSNAASVSPAPAAKAGAAGVLPYVAPPTFSAAVGGVART